MVQSFNQLSEVTSSMKVRLSMIGSFVKLHGQLHDWDRPVRARYSHSLVSDVVDLWFSGSRFHDVPTWCDG
jgi:hypothetical protein